MLYCCDYSSIWHSYFDLDLFFGLRVWRRVNVEEHVPPLDSPLSCFG